MIPEKLQDQVPLFLFGELAGEELRAFEAEMNRSAPLRAEIWQCAHALGALAADVPAAGSVPVRVWKAVEETVEASPAADLDLRETTPDTSLPAAGGGVRRPLTWRAWLWPVAAALLIATNVWQWRAGRADRREARDIATESQGEAVPVVDATGTLDAAPAAQVQNRAGNSDPAARSPAGQSSARNGSTVGEPVDPGQLADEYRRLAEDYAELSGVVIPLLTASLLESQRDGVWTAELRDRSKSAEGNGAGIWERVRDLVPPRGVALLPDRWRLGGGNLLNLDWAQIPGTQGWAIGNTAGPPILNIVDDAQPPFAVALLNPEDGLGYLDVYNLPGLPPGKEMHLWLQYGDDRGAMSVGPLPAPLADGSGALVFRVPVSGAAPVAVKITIEPPGAQSPGGPVVIEGP